MNKPLTRQHQSLNQPKKQEGKVMPHPFLSFRSRLPDIPAPNANFKAREISVLHLDVHPEED